jgi:hypothetical protein
MQNLFLEIKYGFLKTHWKHHFCDTEPFFAEYSKMVSLVFPRTPYQAEPFRGFCVVPDGRTPKKVLQNSFFFSE